jgi:hypothetical protein
MRKSGKNILRRLFESEQEEIADNRHNCTRGDSQMFSLFLTYYYNQLMKDAVNMTGLGNPHVSSFPFMKNAVF